MEKSKRVLTTGQVAKICNVAPRTVSKWFDNGQLRGYRIPGSKDRRIPIDHLVRFMRAHGIPMDELDTGQVRVLILDDDEDLVEVLSAALEKEADYEVYTAESSFEAGAIAETVKPQVLVVETSLADVEPSALVRCIRSRNAFKNTKLVAVNGGLTDGAGQALLQIGFDAYRKKPFDVRELIETIEDTVAAPV